MALLSVIVTYALIILGGTVRVTDSGLACPDWPRCQGQWIPSLEGHVLIEYSHRLAAASVGLIILGTAIAAWLWHRDNRFVVAGATAAVLLVIVQIVVGGVTVNMELPDTIVALHLAIALIILAVLVATAVGAFWYHRLPPSDTSDPNRVLSPGAAPGLAAVTALATFGLILLGSYVANSGAALVYPDWPLFDGRLVSAGGRLADLHWAHRMMAVIVGLLLLGLAVQTWRQGRRPALIAAMGCALVLYVAEVLVGASNIWFELATSVRIVHLALASALWVALVFTVVWTYAERTGASGEIR
ncbi:MAG: COX15/CtaA family protein [Chloroflexi bacterium]|nr:COX15/CtaA family protein [Chloroflexota bacterium]